MTTSRALGSIFMSLASLFFSPLPTCDAATDVFEPMIAIDTGTHTGPIRRLAVDATGTTIVTASDDKTARVWDLATGRMRLVLRVPGGADDVGRLYGAAISPDGSRVAIAGTTAPTGGTHRIYVFQLATGIFERSIDAFGGDIKRLAWLPQPDSIAAVYAGDAALRIFDLQGRLLIEDKFRGDAYGLSLSRSGEIAVSSFDGRIRLYRRSPQGWMRESEFSTRLPDPVGVSHSPDGSYLAVGYFSRTVQGSNGAAVDVFDLRTRALQRSFDFSDIRLGNLMNVAWQSDGNAIFAGGTAYREADSFLVKRISWPDGSTEEVVASRDSILDLAAMPDGRMAFAAAAAWGILDGAELARQSGPAAFGFVQPASFKASDDARVIEWQRDAGASPATFMLPERRLGNQAPSVPLHAADATTFRLPVSGWKDTRRPLVSGKPVALLANESSRAAAVFPDRQSVVLGTSRGLRRLDARGEPIWWRPLNTEARAVNVSADGKIVLAALLDGTIQWRRASDGALLLSLLALQDGRFVVWTEAGYYDASPAAEDLIGWLVARSSDGGADYYGNSRFRDRLYRPDVIDRVLDALDAPAALSAANELRKSQAARSDAEARARVESLDEPLSILAALPPVVTISAPPAIDPIASRVTLDYRVVLPKEESSGPPPEITVRVNGRPMESAASALPQSSTGVSLGRVTLPAPDVASVIQIFANGKHGVSMPAEIALAQPLPRMPSGQASDNRPTLFLLAIGVSQYGNPEIDLGLAAKDAHDFAEVFQRQSGAFYKRVESRVLLDEQATRSAVLDGLEWLQKAATARDVGILFLAGHGVLDADDLYYFLPRGYRPDALARTAVSEVHLRSALSAMRGKSLFFVDTCYSGKSMGRFARRDLVRMANSLSSAESGVIVFSSSAPSQESLEDPAWGNGAFTKALVNGLSGQADFRHEGFITHKGLDYFVAHEVATLTKGRQTPVTTVPSALGDFSLASVPNAPKEVRP